MEVTSEMVKYHPRLWGTIFDNFGKRIKGYKITVDVSCSSKWLYFIPYLTSLIIFF